MLSDGYQETAIGDELLRAGESTSFKTRRGGRARRGRARALAHREPTARQGRTGWQPSKQIRWTWIAWLSTALAVDAESRRLERLLGTKRHVFERCSAECVYEVRVVLETRNARCPVR